MADKKLTLLVISPDEKFRESVKEILLRLDSVELRGECTVYYSALDRQLFTQIESLGVDLALVDVGPHAPDLDNILVTVRKLLDFTIPPTVLAAYESNDTSTMLRLMQAGVLEFIPKPIRLESLLALTMRLSRQGEAAISSARRGNKIYTVFGSKGGCGSTLLATNFALNLLNLSKKNTVLVDLDMYLGEAAVVLGLAARYSIVNAVENSHRLDATLIGGLLTKHKTGLDVLATCEEPEKVLNIRPEQVRGVLNLLSEIYDYVVIDTSNVFDPFAITAFDCSDQVLIISLADLPSLRNTLRCLQTLERLGYKPERVKVVVNRFDRRQDITISEMEKALGKPIFWSFPNDYASAITSINTGTPLYESGQSPVARSIAEFTQKMANLQPSSQNGQKEKSWFHSLLRR
ncbi:MAG: AAA family ATPase [Acidobacteria bacterium]|nr:AAA family ATPase [Acidobacteriota bacterium]MBI3655975.1 AAA family ATPase [Acidobacteriota bacterium]